MQGAIARVCMVVAAAILNHPLLFPQENTTLLEQDEELLLRMKEHEERLELEQMRLEKELSQPDVEEQNEESGESYSWYFWSTLSLVVFFTIEVCRQDLADWETQFLEDEDMDAETGFISSRTLLLDKGILRSFCDLCMHTMAHENWRVKEFVEGFADDLLEALRSVCDKEANMEVGDFVGIGSMFESWRVSKPLMCDLIVPFTPLEPYFFRSKLWCSPYSDVPPNMQGCGRIKVSKAGENKEDCLCGSANFGEDMLCLLHRNTERPKADQTSEDLLCSKNTVYLAKDQVMKWFQISLTKAWGRISHKYEFQLTFRNLDTAGALKIRFPSGKVVVMNIIPVVQLKDTNAYFVPHFPSDVTSSSDTYWPLSFTVYERNLLKHVAKGLPENACHLHCLQILTFLLKKQTGLTGGSFLTNYHLKTAVLHLLLCRASSCWGPGCLELRLRDVLGFLQRSLQNKILYHVLVGNNLVPAVIQIPEMFSRSEPINLFRSLVLQKELYAQTLKHFQEMLRNVPVLIEEYTPVLPNGNVLIRIDSCL